MKTNPTNNTEAKILESYGARLTLKQLGLALGLKPATIRNKISSGSFDIKTYTEGRRRFADFRDVAVYIDRCRTNAK